MQNIKLLGNFQTQVDENKLEIVEVIEVSDGAEYNEHPVAIISSRNIIFPNITFPGIIMRLLLNIAAPKSVFTELVTSNNNEIVKHNESIIVIH